MNTTLLSISLISLVVLLLIVLLKKLKQPYLIAYITAGVILRPVIGHIAFDTQEIERTGEIGLLLLMFFIGMEAHIPDKKSLLIKPVIAQLVKILFSTGFAMFIGYLLHLDTNRILILIALFAFNSTAIVSEYLQRNNQLHTAFGIIILNVLLLQDVLLAPVLTMLRFLGTGHIPIGRLIGAIAVCGLVFFLLKAARNGRMIKLPEFRSIEDDHDLQIFAGISLCLGVGVLAEAVGLTSSIGSFIAGMLIGRTAALRWLEKVLRPFRVFFVAFFFMSIGLQLDIDYIIRQPALVFAVTALVLFSNSILSAIVFRCLRFSWKDSMYAGALMAHTGEFGILVCTVAHQMGLVDADFFRVAIAVISLTLLLSTTWINILKSMTHSRSVY